jgi:hypothetical protein
MRRCQMQSLKHFCRNLERFSLGPSVPSPVMAGLVPAIHVDPGDKPGDADMEGTRIHLVLNCVEVRYFV